MANNDSRCPWCGTDPLYVAYHDEEWGVPETDSRSLWEMLILEGFQSGLSWITILRKRENFRAAFAGFAPDVIASWGDSEVARLLDNTGIIRSRLKIEATIQNARSYLKLEQDEGFSDFIWSYVEGRPIQNSYQSLSDIPSKTPLSETLSKDLKKRGFKFCGPTIAYAFMQAVGMVNDHVITCPSYAKVRNLVQNS